MLVAQFRPLGVWPGTPTKVPRRAPFRSGYIQTLDLLERELDRIDAKNVRVYIDVHPSEIRNDGWIKASAKAVRQGVILQFTSSAGDEISMPCDTFDDWKDNLRAIGLSLEALRAVDRYGVTKSGEQYRGFKALPAPSGTLTTRQEALRALEFLSGERVFEEDEATIDRAFKAAVKIHHPDRGGNRHQYEIALNARKVLEAR